MKIIQRLLVWPQYLVPQAGLSSLARSISRCQWAWFKNSFIRVFVRLFRVKLEEAESPDPGSYDCFNDFFTRRLRPGARPLAGDEHQPICPCDGTVSQAGPILDGRIFQAKGQSFTTGELLGDEALARTFQNGRFATLYLSPRDYHRVHMPLAGQLLTEIHIPGRLFSVNERTAEQVPRLFARNERLAMVFETSSESPLGLVMVAAMLVSGIETAWSPTEYRRTREPKRQDHRPGEQPALHRGDELGLFNWGSTVIVLLPESAPDWHEKIRPGLKVRLGQALTR